MENTYLKYLQLYHNAGDENGALFRTLIDNWYGFSKGGPFLNKNDKPKWFNNPNPVNDRAALLAMDFVSFDAYEVMEGNHQDNLVKDHAIPVRILRQKFKELQAPNLINIRKFLKRYYKLGVITKTEDVLLNQNKLRSNMPDDWDGSSFLARYQAIKICSFKT